MGLEQMEVTTDLNLDMAGGFRATRRGRQRQRRANHKDVTHGFRIPQSTSATRIRHRRQRRADHVDIGHPIAVGDTSTR